MGEGDRRFWVECLAVWTRCREERPPAQELDSGYGAAPLRSPGLPSVQLACLLPPPYSLSVCGRFCFRNSI